MDRKELAAKLDLASPALAASDSIAPVLSHFWLTGTHVMAFDDQTAIRAPLPTDIMGAIPKLALGLVSSAMSKTAAIKIDGTDAVLVAGNMKARLGLLSSDEFIFEMPERDGKAVVPVDVGALAAAIDGCLRSIGTNVQSPDQFGVTLIVSDDGIRLYSTDNYRFSYDRVELTKKFRPGRYVLPAVFCQQLVKLFPKSSNHQIELHKDYAVFRFDVAFARDGEETGDPETCEVFTRLIVAERPLEYEKLLSTHVPGSARKQLVAIPDNIEPMVDRAVLVASLSERRRTRIEIKADPKSKKQFMWLKTAEQVAHLSDAVQVTHKDIAIVIDPKSLKIGLQSFNRFAITDRVMILARDKSEALFLISAISD